MDSQRDARAALEQYCLHGWREVGRELGRGSYAAVVEVDYKGLKCAGKKIYRVLYEQGIGNLVSRFEQECRLLSQLRHPHVVQFLGIYFDPDSNLPVLVMEFLPTTLAQCLDTYGILPEEINYGILRDVALGLRYLHERPQPIVHRDLSANNVLLTSDMRGKISDLGVAKILGLSAAQRSRMTQGPGTAPYMPPEAMVPNPRYDVKVDIFSYGVMMVHVLCGRWPFPGEPVRANPDNPNDLTPVSEVGRRQEYLDDIPKDHPLMELIHRCLRNGPTHRPDASSIAERVSEAASQSRPSFSNKVEMMDRIRVDAEQREGLRRDNETLTQEKDAAVSQQEDIVGQMEELHRQVDEQGRRIESEVKEKESLRERVEVLSRQKEVETREKLSKSLEVEDLQLQLAAVEKDVTRSRESIARKEEAHTEIERAHREAIALKDQTHQIELHARQTKLTLLQQELELSRESAIQKQKTISYLRDQLRRCRSHIATNQQANLLTTPGAKLVWRECAECPIAMCGAQAVVINGIVYVGGGGCDRDAKACIVCKYHPGEDKWATLPPSPVIAFGISQVSGQLVLVGGTARKITADIHVFTSESQQWEKSIPAMPTARLAPSVVSHSTGLVACGGRDQNDKVLPTVELYSSEAPQWYQCPPLPSPRCWMSSVAIGDTLFLMGGFDKLTKPTNSIFSASLSTLINRAIQHSTGGARTQALWTMLKDVRYYQSAAASIGGCLLALGGRDKPDRSLASTSIHTYLPTSSTWHHTGELPLALTRSTAVLLPTNELLIIGGKNKDGHRVKHVNNGSVEV